MYASVESDREFARNVGRDEPDRAWILAPSDAWYPNPFYRGPAVPHPEDDGEDDFIGPRHPYQRLADIPF